MLGLITYRNGSALARGFALAVLSSVVLAFVFFVAALSFVSILNEWLLALFPNNLKYWEYPQLELQIMQVMQPVVLVVFGITAVLIVVGLLLKKGYLSVLGSFTLHLPVFAYFVSSMFPYAGLGALLMLWSPFGSSTVMHLGSIVFLPYMVTDSLMNAVGWGHPLLAFSLMWVGMFFFVFGAVTWLYGKFREIKLIDFWAYRYTRHPQYFGFLLFTYGSIAFSSGSLHALNSISGPPLIFPALPWLISALVVVAIALQEEIKMNTHCGETFSDYRSKTSFLLPLPHLFSKIGQAFTLPSRILFRKKYPENIWEIALITLFYGLILSVLSVPMMLLLR